MNYSVASFSVSLLWLKVVISVDTCCVICVNQVGSKVKSLKQASNMGTRGEWVVSGGHRSSMAECCQPQVLGLAPCSATFLSCPVIASLFERSTDSGGPDCVLIRHHLYWSPNHKGILAIKLPLLWFHFWSYLIDRRCLVCSIGVVGCALCGANCMHCCDLCLVPEWAYCTAPCCNGWRITGL